MINCCEKQRRMDMPKKWNGTHTIKKIYETRYEYGCGLVSIYSIHNTQYTYIYLPDIWLYSCSTDNGSGYRIVNTRHTFIRYCHGIGNNNANRDGDGDVEYICRINLIPIDYYSKSLHQRCHELLLLQHYYSDCSIGLNILCCRLLRSR